MAIRLRDALPPCGSRQRCWVYPYKALAKAARTSERTAERAVQRLEALGVLRVHARHAVWVAPDGTEVRVRTSNGYTFPGATGLDDLLGDLPGVAARVRRLRSG